MYSGSVGITFINIFNIKIIFKSFVRILPNENFYMVLSRSLYSL